MIPNWIGLMPDRICNQDDWSHIHDTSQNQKDQVDQQCQQNLVGCDRCNGTRSKIWHMQVSQTVTEDTGGTAKDQYHS